MGKKEKVKEITLPVKWNIGRHKYEPELPVIKKGKINQVEFVWKEIIILMIVAIALFLGVFLIIKYL
ncbi:hypothetical protein ACFL0X_02900 [Nanoarchaeota archaeon]